MDFIIIVKNLLKIMIIERFIYVLYVIKVDIIKVVMDLKFGLIFTDQKLSPFLCVLCASA